MERRFTQTTTVEVRAEDGKQPVIAGYGARYYDPGDPGTEYTLWDDPSWGTAKERILEGAFDRAVREDDVRGMYNHSQILGRTTAKTMNLSVDKRGLFYEINSPDTQIGRDVMTSIKRKDVTGSSFAFTIPAGGQKWTETQDKDGRYHSLREISEVVLYDTGPVDFPAYESTSAGVRSASDVNEARESLKTARAARENHESRMHADQDITRTRARVAELEI